MSAPRAGLAPSPPPVGVKELGSGPSFLESGDADAQDRLWVQQVQQHDDRAAFARLVQRHQGSVRAVLRRLTHGNTALADELAQESFLRAWQALPGFRGEARFCTWLYRIAYHEFLQHQRLGQARLFVVAAPHAGADEAERPEPASEAPPLSRQVALAIDLERALARLSEAERTAIAHCYFADLSHAEAAQVLGWPLGTVKTHVLRAKAKLGLALAAWRPETSKEHAA